MPHARTRPIVALALVTWLAGCREVAEVLGLEGEAAATRGRDAPVPVNPLAAELDAVIAGEARLQKQVANADGAAFASAAVALGEATGALAQRIEADGAGLEQRWRLQLVGGLLAPMSAEKAQQEEYRRRMGQTIHVHLATLPLEPLPYSKDAELYTKLETNLEAARKKARQGSSSLVAELTTAAAALCACHEDACFEPTSDAYTQVAVALSGLPLTDAEEAAVLEQQVMVVLCLDRSRHG